MYHRYLAWHIRESARLLFCIGRIVASRGLHITAPVNHQARWADLSVYRTRQDVTVDKDHDGWDVAALVEEVSHSGGISPSTLCDAGRVIVNNEQCDPTMTLKAGDKVIVVLPPRYNSEVDFDQCAKQIPVLWHDRDILGIIKPAGMVVHPTTGYLLNNLLSILHYCHHRGDDPESPLPSLVHRIDRNTSGVMVVAMNKVAHAALGKQFADRTVLKEYIAILQGVPHPSSGTINAPLKSMHNNVVISPDGKEAVTKYVVEKTLSNTRSVVRFMPQTGRTHQLRVHAASYLGCPILDDAQYNDETVGQGVGRCALHAHKLEFAHPVSGEQVRLCAPLPADMAAVIEEVQ